MSHTYDYDFFTIGGGSGGVRASRFAAGFGARVAVAEERYLGGTCVNVGCIPKKLISYAAHFNEAFHEAAGFGWTVGERRFNWTALIEAKDREINRLNGVYRNLLVKSGVTVFDARATVVDAHTVAVDGQLITAKHILVATGGWPVLPHIPGIEHAISSNEFFALPDLPATAVVVGGGYIAVELASILNGLGCQVTLVHRREQLLRGMDHELGEVLIKEMRKKGVTIAVDSEVTHIAETDAIKTVMLNNGQSLTAECVLFATGRAPNTAGLGLDKAGVTLTDSGAVVVDDDFQSSVPSIVAIGDVIDRVQLTPVALAEGMVLARRLFDQAGQAMSYDNIPTVVFSHPEVATVGLTEAQAREKHGEVTLFKSDFKALKHTLSGSDERTFMKIIVDTKTDVVLGMHMVGADAGEIIQGFAAALQCGITKAMLDRTIGVHPTSAEEFVTMRAPA
jgi:glutathione reductase (NADPH)